MPTAPALRTDLPIAPLLPALIDTLSQHTRLVLEAPPGAGKTTQVPLALLAAPWLSGRILMLEPRRVAARAAATFMAAQLGEAVGARVGYRIRREARVSAATRVEVVTEAILTRMLQTDPALAGVGAVLFDEFHERNLDADLGLAFALDAQANLRPDLRLIVMSATLEGERLSRFLDAPRLTSAGRGFPVAIEYLAPRADPDGLIALRQALARARAETDADVLVFLPGKGEIERARRALESSWPEATWLALHGELELAEQSRALAAPQAGERRVVLATNVAESSVTLPAVKAVIDSGLAREPRYDPVSGFSRLETVSISQASAAQRAGRAGRVAPGRCWRLWPESQRLEPGLRAEINQVELSALALELAAWGTADLEWLDPPPAGPLAEARARLTEFSALDDAGRITEHGRALLALGLHPRLAHMVLAAPEALRALACDLAALLEARDPMRGEARRSDDLRERLDALAAQRRATPVVAAIDTRALAEIARNAAELGRHIGVPAARQIADAHAVGELLALAYPDRIARADPAHPRRYQLANGRGARLADDSRLLGSPWLAISELRPEARDALIQRAAPLDDAHLAETMGARFSIAHELAFNPDTRAVECHESRRFDQLLLERRRLPLPRDGSAAPLLIAGIRTLGLAVLPFSAAQQQWCARVQCLAAWCPELALPALDETSLLATLETWLAPWLGERTRIDAIDAAVLGEALGARLDHAQRRALDEHAPVSLTVPSGRSLRLDYAPGRAPVLAVKLQELFGLAEGPRVAKGRVAVTLELLSPAQRPIQVTQDLAGFWQRTYPEVKKELKGRYPRHPWPDDPCNAPATHRAKPRG
jgi:ATP-dependent helicase HrpB